MKSSSNDYNNNNNNNNHNSNRNNQHQGYPRRTTNTNNYEDRQKRRRYGQHQQQQSLHQQQQQQYQYQQQDNTSMLPIVTQYTTDNDPFPNALRCTRIVDTDSDTYPTVDWYSPYDPVPISIEQRIQPLLIQYGTKERGMFKTQPQHRLYKILAAIDQINYNYTSKQTTATATNTDDTNIIISVCQVLSLRRHYIKQNNLNLSMVQLNLGNENDIMTSATLFENCIEQQLLQHCNVLYYNEQYQKQHIQTKKPYNEPYPPTPDFILQTPITICTYKYVETKKTAIDHDIKSNDNENSKDNAHDKTTTSTTTKTMEKMTIRKHTIGWIEVKMFYGASSIPNDNKSAVGCILTTATKYVKCHGPGAILFLYGYGELLEKQLLQLGVIPLDCSYHYNNSYNKIYNIIPSMIPNTNTNDSSTEQKQQQENDCDNRIREMIHHIDLTDVIEHQKKWCANKDGMVLP